jgi:hypothetical protein
MTKLFYHLEDYFDALAQQRRGAMKWLSRSLRTLFGFAGDLFKSRIDSVNGANFDAKDALFDADVAR